MYLFPICSIFNSPNLQTLLILQQQRPSKLCSFLTRPDFSTSSRITPWVINFWKISNKFLIFFIKAWSLLHQGKKRTTVEDNVSEDGNIQLHEEIIDTIIEKRQSRENSSPGIISKLVIGIKKIWTEDSKNNSLFKGLQRPIGCPWKLLIHKSFSPRWWYFEKQKHAAWKMFQHEKAEYISTIFLSPKFDGLFWMILNLKKLDDHMPYIQFKLETIKSVLNLVIPNCCIAKIDIKDAYHSIPILPEHQKVLKFNFQGQPCKFIYLPNGLCSDPRKFTKLLKPSLARLRLDYVKIAAYIDNLVTLA